MANSVDAQLFQNISASQGPFPLKGGYYMVAGVGTWSGGNVELQVLGPDGVTYLSLPTALKLTANGTIAGYVPPGQCKFTITGTPTAVYVSAAGVPIA